MTSCANRATHFQKTQNKSKKQSSKQAEQTTAFFFACPP
jgi:hypothetical protein